MVYLDKLVNKKKVNFINPVTLFYRITYTTYSYVYPILTIALQLANADVI